MLKRKGTIPHSISEGVVTLTQILPLPPNKRDKKTYLSGCNQKSTHIPQLHGNLKR